MEAIKLCKEFVEDTEFRQELKKVTYKSYHAHLQKFISFEIWKQKEDKEFKLDVSFFNKNGMAEFYKYLTTEKRYKNTYTRKVMMFVRRFLRWVESHDISIPPIEAVRIKQVKRTIIFLSKEELKMFMAYKPDSEKSEIAQDVFVFACFTGLRVSDIQRLTWANIKKDTIEIVVEKTLAKISIDLNNHSRKILEKYQNKTSSSFVFNLYPRDFIPLNKELKNIGKKIGLTQMIENNYMVGTERCVEVKEKCEFLSMHAGRRTFVCLCIYKGIPRDVIMKWTGHKDYETMEAYVEVVENQKSEEMLKLNNL